MEHDSSCLQSRNRRLARAYCWSVLPWLLLPSLSGWAELAQPVTDTVATALSGANAEQPVQRRLLEIAMLVAMLVMAAVYSLSIYSQRRHNQAPLWLMSACGCLAIFYLCSSGLLANLAQLRNPLLLEWSVRLGHVALGWTPYFILLFYHHSFRPVLPRRMFYLVSRINLFFSLSLLFLPTMVQKLLLTALLGFISLQFVVGLALLVRAFANRESFARPMLLASLPILLTAPYDFYHYLFFGQTPVWVLYALLFFVFVESQIIGLRFANAFSVAERLTHHLKEEVSLQTAELHDQNNKLARAQQALQAANIELRKLSITDGLTGVHNRLYFDQELRKEWRRCTRQQLPISIIMLDADHFKALNDQAGHLAGDHCLKIIAEQLQNHCKRAGELIARYGGEEFVAMLPDTTLSEARIIAENLRQSIAELVIPFRNDSLQVTVSVGVSSTTPTTSQPPEQLLSAADAALYEAKNQGRNRVCSLPLLPRQPNHFQRLRGNDSA